MGAPAWMVGVLLPIARLELVDERREDRDQRDLVRVRVRVRVRGRGRGRGRGRCRVRVRVRVRVAWRWA